MDYKQTIKERLGLLSPELRGFVLNENWRRDAEKIGKQFSFDEQKYALFENEIFFVLLGFEPETDFKENIKNEVALDPNMANWIAEDVGKNIFNKVTRELSAFEKEASANESKPQNNIGNSFEQIILNQAKAMQPARPADEAGRVTSYGVRDTNRAPGNLPVEKEVAPMSKPQISVPNYSGNDPYREQPN